VGEALNVIKDDRKGGSNIGGTGRPCNRPAFLWRQGFLTPKAWPAGKRPVIRWQASAWTAAGWNGEELGAAIQQRRITIE
jgi:hypothetical protein